MGMFRNLRLFAARFLPERRFPLTGRMIPERIQCEQTQNQYIQQDQNKYRATGSHKIDRNRSIRRMHKGEQRKHAEHRRRTCHQKRRCLKELTRTGFEILKNHNIDKQKIV